MRKGGNLTTIDAEIYLFEDQLKHLDKEESRYLRLYGVGRWELEQLVSETDKLRGKKDILKARLDMLKKTKQAIIEANIAHENITRTANEIANRIDYATYELKQLALDMLDIKLTLYPDLTVNVLGSFPLSELSLAKP